MEKKRTVRTGKPRLQDVALVAGVSTATVSNVLNRKDSVPEVTRARVERIMKDLGYEPNEHAVALRRHPWAANVTARPRRELCPLPINTHLNSRTKTVFPERHRQVGVYFNPSLCRGALSPGLGLHLSIADTPRVLSRQLTPPSGRPSRK